MKRRVLAALAVMGALLAVIGFGYRHRYAASIGIIGGADGPTAIFVAGKSGLLLLAGLALLLLAAAGAVIAHWRKRGR